MLIGQPVRKDRIMEANMTKNVGGLLSEALGAALGTGLGVAVVGYVAFTLITNSLEALF